MIQKSSTETIVDKEHFELLKRELTSTKLELNQVKEREKNLSTQLKDLEIQHTKTVFVFDRLIVIIISILDSRIE
jgi:CII-binding regulator of phage lambda lysogenization HflD